MAAGEHGPSVTSRQSFVLAGVRRHRTTGKRLVWGDRKDRVHLFIQRTLPVRLPPALWQVPQGTTGSLTSRRPQAGDGRQGTSALTRQMYNLMSGGN